MHLIACQGRQCDSLPAAPQLAAKSWLGLWRACHLERLSRQHAASSGSVQPLGHSRGARALQHAQWQRLAGLDSAGTLRVHHGCSHLHPTRLRLRLGLVRDRNTREKRKERIDSFVGSCVCVCVCFNRNSGSASAIRIPKDKTQTSVAQLPYRHARVVGPRSGCRGGGVACRAGRRDTRHPTVQINSTA